jgi:hypothetical protein
VEVHEKAVGICQEFTDYILFDRTRHSIIVNIETRYFKYIIKELKKLGYSLIFTKQFKDNNTITCTFKI